MSKEFIHTEFKDTDWGNRHRQLAFRPDAVTCISETHDQQTCIYFEGFAHGRYIDMPFSEVLKRIRDSNSE
jgi:hypothetical protein